MVSRSRTSLRRISVVGAVVGTASCYCGPPPEPDPDPAIKTIEILPVAVTAEKGTIFSVRARVLDEWGNVLPDSRADAVTWKSLTGALNVPTGPRAAVNVTADPGDVSLPVSADLVASVDGVSKSATITIVGSAQSSSSNLDWITADYVPDQTPTIALVDGISMTSGAHPLTNAMIGFVHQGPLDEIDCPDGSACGSVTVFSANHALSRATVRWSSTCDFADVTSGAPTPAGCRTVDQTAGSLAPAAPLVIPVFVWNASSTPTSEINDDMNYAGSVFESGWSGLSFQIHPRRDVTPASILYGGDTFGCKPGGSANITAQLPQIPLDEFKRDRITVIFVDEVNPGDGAISGFTCQYDASEGTIIIMAGSGDGSSKLAHELGHALGQWRPPAPLHPDIPRLAGFEPSNLMWSSDVDWSGALRKHLTLGQLFQMSFNFVSFVKTAGPSSTQTLTCNPDPASNVPCPPLAKDVTR